MSYNKNTWETGDIITKEKLNNMENGIYNAHDEIETLKNNTSSGTGITPEQAQQLSTAYQHSQSTHAPSNAEANVQVDWNVTDTTSDAYIKNKPTNLATTDQIPTVPTKTSELTNDSDYVNSTYVTNKIAEAALSGGDVDLSGYVTKETGNANQITFSDGQTFQAKLDAGTLKGEKGDQGPKGDKGDPGEPGVAGANGQDGEDGATFTPSVDTQGNLSWTNDKGLVNPPTVNIKGEKGDSGTGNSGANINDTTASATTTYSSNKIEAIKEGLNSQIKEITTKKIYQFDSVASMKAYNLKVGEICETLGYYTVNDLGGSKYYITNDSSLTADGGSVHTLNNGLKAKLIVNNDLVNVRQFGAKGDGTTDDTNAINTALKTFDNVFMPPGNYFINSTIKMRLNTRLNGSFYKTTVLLIGSNLKDKNVIEYGSSYAYNSMNGKISNIKLQPKDESKNIGLGIYLYSSLHMDNVYFYKLQCCINKNSGYIDNIRITNCNFCYCIGTSSQYIIELQGAGDGLEISQIHLVDAYTDRTSGESQYTKYRGIHVTGNTGGKIENCIINGPISLYNCKGFKVSNLHVEGSQHGNYKGNLSWINICNSKVKMENIYMHKRADGPNIKLETYATSDPKESNDVIIENLCICYPKHLMSLMKCYNDDNSFDIDKDKLSTLKLKNCFVYSDFSSTWTTTNSTVGVRIKGIDDFNKHSSYYSNNCEVGICNNVLTDIPACKNNPEYKDTSIFSYSSSNSNIPWFESNCNETKQFITGVYCFDYERRLALLKNTVELEIPTTTTTTSASGKGIMLRNPYSSILDGIGLELIIYRGKSSNNYNKITRVPCCTSYFVFDYGTNIMGIPTKTRTPSPIDDFNYVYKFRTINGSENVEFYAPTPPVYGTFKKFDRCINTNISDSEPKKWIYDGSTWVALN